jgi:hypothetical protein
MKALLFALTFLLVACGVEDLPVENGANLGELRTLDGENTFTEGEVNTIKSVCNTLSSKKNYIQTAVVPSAQNNFTFKNSYQSCDGGQQDKNVIVRMTSNLNFQLLNGQGRIQSYLFFNDIPTDTSALTAKICDSIQSSNTREVKSGEYVYFYGLAGDCAQGTACFIMMTGLDSGQTQEQEDGSTLPLYQLISRDLLHLQLSAGPLGVQGLTIKRQRTSIATCNGNGSESLTSERL